MRLGCLNIMSELTKEQRQSQGIKDSWSLKDFARAHGKMSVCTVKATKGPNTGQDFRTCRFAGKPATETTPAVGMAFCAFSEKLGIKTAAEIAAMADELQVVQLQESGNFMLCHAGTFREEEAVDLGL